MPKSSDRRPLKTPWRQRAKFFLRTLIYLGILVCGLFPVDPFLRNSMLQADHGSEEKG
jgi:hypothetical protein